MMTRTMIARDPLFALAGAMARRLDPAACGAECACATPGVGATVQPRADVVETDAAWLVTAEIPGARRESIEVTVEDGVLSLVAAVPARDDASAVVRRYERRFRVRGDVDVAAIDAAYADGVLTITLPKGERARPRRIEVHGG